MRREAHKVKGACTAIGAEIMTEIAETLQALAEQEMLDEARDLAGRLVAEFERVKVALAAESRARQSA